MQVHLSCWHLYCSNKERRILSKVRLDVITKQQNKKTMLLNQMREGIQKRRMGVSNILLSRDLFEQEDERANIDGYALQIVRARNELREMTLTEAEIHARLVEARLLAIGREPIQEEEEEREGACIEEKVDPRGYSGQDSSDDAWTGPEMLRFTIEDRARAAGAGGDGRGSNRKMRTRSRIS